ncbi:hypothetical protein [Streptomyces kaempferi]|uniref:Uncharacterized protein n=1 Tax=Streptomyces kaempferi TaxID=333725 RepID=A0ABW3XNL8_9ACTN
MTGNEERQTCADLNLDVQRRGHRLSQTQQVKPSSRDETHSAVSLTVEGTQQLDDV